jgi:sarcosine oxidase
MPFYTPTVPGVDIDNKLIVMRCLYTNSPDKEFVVGHHPAGDGRVLVATGFFGEGFKFAPLIGEMVADLVTNAPEAVPGIRERFAPGRFFGGQEIKAPAVWK